MTHTRDDMQNALKQRVVPHLRSAGFKGSLPHFYRVSGEWVDLLTVQYHSGGSCLLIEVSSVKPNPGIKPATMRVHAFGNRLRLHRESNRNDHWFCYTPHGLFAPMQAPQEIADQLKSLLATQAEEWWANGKALAANNSFKPKPLRGSA